MHKNLIIVILTRLIKQASEECGVLFRKRMEDFIPNAINQIKFECLVKKAVGKRNAEELKDSLLRSLPFRTALQNKAMIKIAQVAFVNGKDSTVFKGIR